MLVCMITVLCQELCKGVVTLCVTRNRDLYGHYRNICNNVMMNNISSMILLCQEYDSLLQIIVYIHNMPGCLDITSGVVS